jgi:MFS family permease
VPKTADEANCQTGSARIGYTEGWLAVDYPGKARLSKRSPHDPYFALRFPDFRLLLTGSVIVSLGGQMAALAIGWEMYERTNSALALGLIGLVELLPVVLLALVTGHAADRYNRKTIAMVSRVVMVVASFGLAALSFGKGPIVAVYGCILLQGIGEAFNNPAASALIAEVLPEEAFENSATWSTSIRTLAAVLGPALGGAIIALNNLAAPVYVINAICSFLFVVMLLRLRGSYGGDHRLIEREEQSSLRAFGEGIAFLRRTPVMLAPITLDLFAVLFGGATTLLPIFAKDILFVGPTGLGWLQAAASIGAAVVAFVLAHRPPLQRAGPTLLVAVAGFGVATIVFGISQWFWLSFAMLFALGGLDGISMIIRDTLLLTRTPHEMRGRVSAIEGLFVSSSNQLGGFESGVTAALFGPILSVVGGGVGTVVVVLIVAFAWPELRGLRTLRDVPREVVVT